tara:strand:- start:159 stop:461 length:303 start_codon:yes stop_codon:yes gene_type:complete
MNDTKEKRATFTAGPWVVKHDKEGLPFIGVASDPWTYPGTVATVEQEKDARLIAAAPEMYQLLREILLEYEAEAKAEGWDLPTSGEMIREVLAKVEGGEG